MRSTTSSHSPKPAASGAGAISTENKNLYRAVRIFNIPAIKTLIKEGVDVNFNSAVFGTALHYLIENASKNNTPTSNRNYKECFTLLYSATSYATHRIPCSTGCTPKALAMSMGVVATPRAAVLIADKYTKPVTSSDTHSAKSTYGYRPS